MKGPIFVNCAKSDVGQIGHFYARNLPLSTEMAINLQVSS